MLMSSYLILVGIVFPKIDRSSAQTEIFSCLISKFLIFSNSIVNGISTLYSNVNSTTVIGINVRL